jgi:hypothetical protein
MTCSHVCLCQVSALECWGRQFGSPNGAFPHGRGDGATSDLPLLSFNIDRSQPNAGWQIPYWEHWTRHALSLAQSLVWGECVRTR